VWKMVASNDLGSILLLSFSTLVICIYIYVTNNFV